MKLALSATPPGKMVLTTTPVLRPPMMPNPSPDPSFTRSITSTWAHSVFNWNQTVTISGKRSNKTYSVLLKRHV